MKHLPTLLVLCLAAAAAALPGVKAQYSGGTLAELERGANVRLDLSGKEALAVRTAKCEHLVPYLKVNTVEYGQTVSRRYAEAVIISPLLLLSKSRKHFLTVGYTDAQGQQQALVLQIGKKDIRAVLAALEARTGRRVEYQDDEARKSGRG